MHHHINETVQRGEYIRNNKDNNTRNDNHNIVYEKQCFYSGTRTLSPHKSLSKTGQQRSIPSCFVDRKMLHHCATSGLTCISQAFIQNTLTFRTNQGKTNKTSTS